MRITSSIVRLFSASLLVLGGAVAFTAGPPAGFTGGGNEANCYACHAGAALNAGPAVFALNASPSLVSGTATITAAFTSTPSSKHGFQMMGLNSAGAYLSGWALTNATTTQKTGPNHVNHTSSGTLQTSWSANISPGTLPAGPVTFYAAGNQTNANNAPNGDNVYTRSFKVYQAELVAGATWPLGTVQALSLIAPTVPSHLYVIAVSELASPSTPLGGPFTVPINLAGQFVSLAWSMPTIFQNFIGALDVAGYATAAVAIPNIPALTGLTLNFAYATVNPANSAISEVSNAIARTL